MHLLLSSFACQLLVFADLQIVSYGVVMKKSDLEFLKRFRFISCQVTTQNTPIDEGARVYIEQSLPEYLQRREIIDGDALNTVTVQNGEQQVLWRFLVPCAAGCKSLGDPVRAGCRILHVAAHHPDWSIAQLAASGQPICLAEKIFYQDVYEAALYLYSDGSLLLQRYPEQHSPPQTFDNIPAFIKIYAGDMAEADLESALQRFRLYCAQFHIDAWFEAFLPK